VDTGILPCTSSFPVKKQPIHEDRFRYWLRSDNAQEGQSDHALSLFLSRQGIDHSIESSEI
jgi:hypothetical protein